MENNKEQYYIVRCDRAGVFFGQIKSREGREVTMTHARKIWYWKGATETLQLSAEGVKEPDKCRFTLWVDEIVLLEAIEVIPCTELAAARLCEVPVWKV